jgi:cell division septum initiation protein DivIVA
MGIRRDFDLHDVTLEETPFRPEGGFDTVVHGYDRAEVDRFATRIERAVTELSVRYRRSQARERDLADQVAQLKAQLITESRQRSVEQLPPTQWLAGRMEQIFTVAEQTAVELSEQAHADAEAAREAARCDAEETRAAAQHDAAEIRATALREAEEARSAARQEAEETLAAARQEAEQTHATAHRDAEAAVLDANTRADATVLEANTRAEVILAEAQAHAARLTRSEEQRAARLAGLRHRLQREILVIHQTIERLAGPDPDFRPSADLSTAPTEVIPAVSADADQPDAAAPAGRDRHWQITNPPRNTPRPRDAQRVEPQHAETA